MGVVICRPPAVDTTPPSLSFSPATLIVESGKTGTSTLEASDNVGVTSGPNVSCTNEGTFAGSTFTAPGFDTSVMTSICTATASDAAGNTSTFTLTVTMNPAPVSMTSVEVTRDKSIVSEGQPFILDGSNSTSTDGALTFVYRQTAGTPVTFADPTTPIQNLTAPAVSANETLEFEVDVSTPTGTTTSFLTINVENFSGIETISDPTSFDAGNSLPFLRGMIANDNGGYTLHWVNNQISSPSPTSSQSFTAEGVKLGGQTNGEFQAASNQLVGVAADMIENGDTLYYVNIFIDAANMLGVTTHRGLVSGIAFSFGDEFQSPINSINPGGDTVPFGSNSILNITTGDIAGAAHFANSYIIRSDGTSIETALTGPDDNIDIDGGTVAVFGDNNYVGIWAEENSDTSGFGIQMQRVASGGTLLSRPVTVNEKMELDQLTPNAATMSDGNVFVAWADPAGSQGNNSIKARIIQPDGTFATSEFLVTTRTNQEGVPVSPHVTALNTNQVLVSWMVGIPISNEIEAQAFNADGTAASNVFSIQSFDPTAPDQSSSNVVSLNSVTLTDNRVILGWTNQAPTETSHTVGFYPVGKP